MSEHPGQQSDEGWTDAAVEFPSLPSPLLRDRERETSRQRKQRLILLALLLGIGVLVLGAWVSQPPDRENLNLPRVTLEVWGMT
jgi:hypothetical protein